MYAMTTFVQGEIDPTELAIESACELVWASGARRCGRVRQVAQPTQHGEADGATAHPLLVAPCPCSRLGTPAGTCTAFAVAAEAF